MYNNNNYDGHDPPPMRIVHCWLWIVAVVSFKFKEFLIATANVYIYMYSILLGITINFKW